MSYSDEQVQEMLKGGALDRIALAKAGQALEMLVYDENWQVRMEVAENGYCLDLLVYDEDWAVRHVVAEKGYGLGILISDTGWLVRLEVASKGYGLGILVNDEHKIVRQKAESMVGYKRHVVDADIGKGGEGLILYTWDDRYVVQLGGSDAENVVRWAINSKDDMDTATIDKCVTKIQRIIEAELTDEREIGMLERWNQANKGQDLDTLLHDENPEVRLAVAKQRHRLDVLVSDEHWQVRREVARQGYGLELLLNDSSLQVRELAQKGTS